MERIKVGDMAHEFDLMDQKDNQIRLSDFRGKKVLMSFHPFAFTSTCTDQMRALEVNYDRLQALNVVPLGFSVDPGDCKFVWAAALSIEKLSMPSDFWPHGKVAMDYGIFNEKNGASLRANILIDENGKVIWVRVYKPGERPDIEEVISFIEGYQG